MSWALATVLIGCTGAPADSGNNAFIDGERFAGTGKADTGYQTSLDAQEIEVDLEGDVQATNIWVAPLSLGQFALTYLRQHNDLYIQSLAEDYAHGTDHIEWLVDGAWTTPSASPTLDATKLSHFRLRGISAVLMHPGDTTKLLGRAYAPPAPRNPDTIFDDAGDQCATDSDGLGIGLSDYWYSWDPDKETCKPALKQPLAVTISKVIDQGHITYPEYDRLIADGRLDVLVFFGRASHLSEGALTDDDFAFGQVASFAAALEAAGFAKAGAADTPRGVRYTRTTASKMSGQPLQVVVDIYSPREFEGLADTAHFAAFDDGVRTHEIVAYNGHSLLGASDFWARPNVYDGDGDPKRYQIFLYNGCLGYEYYINPILEAKGGWQNVDVVSNVLETQFYYMEPTITAAISMIVGGAEKTGQVSWQEILTKMNEISGDAAYYGASGVRDNAFKPAP